MTKTKATKATKAKNGAPRAAKRRGKAARLAALDETIDAATALLSDGSGHHAKVAMPRKGAGRRRMVDVDSLDGIAAQLANELAAAVVGEIRIVADRMVRTTLATMLAKM
jgi:hypothetical protein